MTTLRRGSARSSCLPPPATRHCLLALDPDARDNREAAVSYFVEQYRFMLEDNIDWLTQSPRRRGGSAFLCSACSSRRRPRPSGRTRLGWDAREGRRGIPGRYEIADGHVVLTTWHGKLQEVIYQTRPTMRPGRPAATKSCLPTTATGTSSTRFWTTASARRTGGQHGAVRPVELRDGLHDSRYNGVSRGQVGVARTPNEAHMTCSTELSLTSKRF